MKNKESAQMLCRGDEVILSLCFPNTRWDDGVTCVFSDKCLN